MEKNRIFIGGFYGKKIIISLAIVGGIVFSFFQFYYLASKPTTSNAFEPEIYTISPAEKIFINGKIEPIETKEIYIDPSKGTVNKTYVTNGQIVKKGELLFEYRNSSITEQIEQSDIQIEAYNKQIEQMKSKKKNSQKKLEEKKNLKEQREQKKQQVLDKEQNPEGEQQDSQQIDVTNIGFSDVDNSVLEGEIAALENEIITYDEQIVTIQNQVNTVRKQKDLLKKKEAFEETAPINGRVLLRASDNPQLALLTIESTEYYVKGTTSEKDLPKLEIGQPAEVLIHSTNELVTGKIQFIGDRPITSDISVGAANSNANVSSYVLIIQLDSQEKLINGFHVQANVKQSKSIVKIPKNAILEEEGSSYVFKVQEKKYIKQAITYSDVNLKEVSVSSGLKENDQVVLNPPSILEKEGMVNE